MKIFSSLNTCLLLLCALLTCSGEAAAQFTYEETVRNATGREAKLPLLIAFHYSGGTPAQSIADYSDLKTPVRIIAVRGEYQKRQGYSYFPVDYYEMPPERQHAVADATVERLAAFVNAMGQRYGVRPVVTGISQGGDIAFLMAAEYPASISAALPFAPVIPAGLHVAAPTGAARPPIYVYQGEDDPIVQVALTRRRVAELQAQLPISLETFPNLGHDISPEMKASYTRRLDGLLGTVGKP